MPRRGRLGLAHGGPVTGTDLFADWDDDRWRSYEYPPKKSSFGPRLVLEVADRFDLLGTASLRADPCCLHADLTLSATLPGHVFGACCRHPGEVRVMRCCVPEHLICPAWDQHRVSYRAVVGEAR